MRVDQLTGASLDRAVALAEGKDPNCCHAELLNGDGEYFSPSTNPAQAYPIIEREKINVSWLMFTWEPQGHWFGSVEITPDEDHLAAGLKDAEPKRIGCRGATPLEAAMRCYVKLRFGDEVEV